MICIYYQEIDNQFDISAIIRPFQVWYSNTLYKLVIAHQNKSADLKLQNIQALAQKSFAVIANMADDLY